MVGQVRKGKHLSASKGEGIAAIAPYMSRKQQQKLNLKKSYSLKRASAAYIKDCQESS